MDLRPAIQKGDAAYVWGKRVCLLSTLKYNRGSGAELPLKTKGNRLEC